MDVWDVLGKRSAGDELIVVGGITAPDVNMALLLARETHFRHKEGVAYAVRRRGDREVHEGTYEGEALGGLTDRAYRRQEGYVGVGAKLKRIREEMSQRGLVIDRPRPAPGRGPGPDRGPRQGGEVPETGRVRDISPEDLAAQGTAG
jgi:1,2-phenylacetyl-CoA epoxidase PaaB subunit